jgi:hypothetical protein
LPLASNNEILSPLSSNLNSQPPSFNTTPLSDLVFSSKVVALTLGVSTPEVGLIVDANLSLSASTSI